MAKFSTNDVGESEYESTAGASAQDDRDSGRTDGECSSVEIEPTKNGGFAVSARYRQPESKGGAMPYMEPEKYAFSTLQELFAFLTTKFGSAAPAASVETDTAAAPAAPLPADTSDEDS